MAFNQLNMNENKTRVAVVFGGRSGEHDTPQCRRGRFETTDASLGAREETRESRAPVAADRTAAV